MLTAEDYIWRWDTDWFWCSRALGVQHPVVRRFWPRRWRRSDVYRRIVALDRRTGLSGRVRHLRGLPLEERARSAGGESSGDASRVMWEAGTTKR